MPSDRSFTDYIKTRFYNNIYSAVDGFVEQSWKALICVFPMFTLSAQTQGDGLG